MGQDRGDGRCLWTFCGRSFPLIGRSLSNVNRRGVKAIRGLKWSGTFSTAFHGGSFLTRLGGFIGRGAAVILVGIFEYILMWGWDPVLDNRSLLEVFVDMIESLIDSLESLAFEIPWGLTESAPEFGLSVGSDSTTF